jgi:hypothetical protein
VRGLALHGLQVLNTQSLLLLNMLLLLAVVAVEDHMLVVEAQAATDHPLLANQLVVVAPLNLF